MFQGVALKDSQLRVEGLGVVQSLGFNPSCGVHNCLGRVYEVLLTGQVLSAFITA